jgi:hypothetical protein
MRRNTPKRAKRNQDAKVWRDVHRKEVGCCDLCGCRKLDLLEVHEIGLAGGPNRHKAMDKSYSVLVLCSGFANDCHAKVQTWPEARQLALMLVKRPESYDLCSHLLLTRPSAIRRITQEEVDIEVTAWIRGKEWK